MKFEGSMLEYKREYVPEIRKTVVAFANTNGGSLYIGVDDDGTAIGVEDPDEVILQVTNMVRDAIRPDVTMFVTCDAEKMGGKPVVALHVQRGTAAPYYLAGKGIRPEGVYVRQGASSVPATESAILRMIKDTDGDDYEGIRSLVQELTFEETERAFKKEGLAFGSSQFRTLGLVNEDGIFTNLALLLSDQNPHAIKAAVFEGARKTTFKDRFEFTGSLLRQLEEASAFINRYNSTRSRIDGLRRVDERDYPDEAIREALLNTVVHRDYAFSGPGLISVFDDRMEFVTLGGLVKGITLEDLDLGISIIRNKRLANVFYRLGLIEAYGTGVPKIRESYAPYPFGADIQASDNAFKIVLPNVHAASTKGPEPHAVLTDRETMAMDLLHRKPSVHRKDLEDELSVSLSMANRILKSLIEQDLVEQIGRGRSTRYRLKNDQ